MDSSSQDIPVTEQASKRPSQAAAKPGTRTAIGGSGLSFVAEVPVRLTVELGSTQMRVRDVLALEPGAVVELDRDVSEPADIRVNGRLIARGEVTVIDERVAVRITEVIGTSSETRSG